MESYGRCVRKNESPTQEASGANVFTCFNQEQQTLLAGTLKVILRSICRSETLLVAVGNSEKLYGIQFGWGFNSTLSALASARCWDHALALLRDMQGGGNLLGEPAKWHWRRSIQSLQSSNTRSGSIKVMPAMGYKKHANFSSWILNWHWFCYIACPAGRADPNVVSYNTAISACADGEGEWEHAIQLLKQMQRCQVEPDCWRVVMRHGDLAWGIDLYIENASRQWLVFWGATFVWFRWWSSNNALFWGERNPNQEFGCFVWPVLVLWNCTMNLWHLLALHQWTYIPGYTSQ